MNDLIDIKAVQSRMLLIRDQPVLLDRDVADLYGVETKAVNQAVRNNPEKFPAGYVIELSQELISEGGDDLRSKILTANISSKSRVPPKVFTEKGIYMLATILKGERAVQTTIKIIETYAQVRELKRELVALHTETDKRKKTSLRSHVRSFGRNCVRRMASADIKNFDLQLPPQGVFKVTTCDLEGCHSMTDSTYNFFGTGSRFARSGARICRMEPLFFVKM